MKIALPSLGLALIILAAVNCASCATIISGTTQAVSIDSNVKGATVKIEGNLVGQTPFNGKIKRQREALAEVSAPGYAAQPITLTSSYNPVAILSIFWDYSTTDCLTGACWEYAPNTYYVNLKSEATSDAEFKRQSSLLAFSMTYFGDLSVELAAGDGMLLRSLHREHFSQLQFADFVTEMRSVSSSNAVAFGEAVAVRAAS